MMRRILRLDRRGKLAAGQPVDSGARTESRQAPATAAHILFSRRHPDPERSEGEGPLGLAETLLSSAHRGPSPSAQDDAIFQGNAMKIRNAVCIAALLLPASLAAQKQRFASLADALQSAPVLAGRGAP